MDWRSIQFDWNQARAFLVTAEEGSLSAAARALGLTQPTLSRQVAALEQGLGAQLFDRVNAGLTLTPTGVELLEHVKKMGEAANGLSLNASGLSSTLEGNVCISVAESTAFFMLPPILKALKQQFPAIRIELVVSNESSDLTRREADIAIRAYRPTQPDLITRKLKGYAGRLYANRQYWASLTQQFGENAIHHADFISFANTFEYAELLKQYFNLSIEQSQMSIITANHLVHWQLVKQGLGVGVMSTNIGDKEPEVIAILPDKPPVEGETWLVTHQELRTSLRIRKVFDFLADKLGGG